MSYFIVTFTKPIKKQNKIIKAGKLDTIEKAWYFVYCSGGTGLPDKQINKPTPSVSIAYPCLPLKSASFPEQGS
ncbi:hypothetical protein MP478_18750 [Chryseobacterium sp. WG14]|uniref:hypothetical protein n=1 Tax=Chryseobacterium sp. WG14 TaxID=2926909 RepID=UPI00211DE69B|nr:hypothetical protein [Chryseobacterium sp. WG14]MCQ9641425.1 hypothetical protein [Chryseobacterium sp. WG14]